MEYTEALRIYKAASAKLGKPFVECEEQEECVRKLILWAIRSPEYPGRLNAGIFLRGRRDTGKTHAFRCINKLLAVMNGGAGSGSTFNEKVCQEIVSDYNQRGEEALDFSHDNNFATLFDDLGEERDGNFMGKPCNVMAEIIQARYRRMQYIQLVSMFTSNLPGDKEITDRYGERVTTRLQEMCDFILWRGPAEGYRKKVDPLPWKWATAGNWQTTPPPSPEHAAEMKARADAAIAKTTEALDIRRRQEREAKDAVRAKKVAEEIALLRKEPLGVLTNYARMHPYPEVKQAAKAEIAKRTTLPLEDVYAAADTPIATEGKDAA